MKKLVSKIKIDKNVLLKTFFLILLSILLIFFLINHTYLQFLANGFNQIAKADLQVYFFDVGQASSSLIIFPNDCSMLIDTGSKDSRNELLSQLDVALSENGLKKIDFLLLTHSDADHTGGVKSVLDKYQVDNIYRPKLTSDSSLENEIDFKRVETLTYAEAISSIMSEPNCEVSCVEKRFIDFGDAFVSIYPGEKEKYSETNAYSPFVTVSFENKTFLFTGDVTQEREEEFLDDIEMLNLQIDFLSVSHHGSKYSSSERFLEAISPKYSFVSAGDKTHPSNEVLHRLKGVGVEEVFCTKTQGMLAVGIFDDGDFKIKTETNYIDLPFIIVLLFCGCFAVLKIDFYNLKYYNRKYFKHF